MQGKVESEHCASPYNDVGIDVCKAWLDVHILPVEIAIRFPNTKKGHSQLVTLLRRHEIRRIVIEATGKFHRSVHARLHDAGWHVAIVNPLRARLFAEAIGTLAKTDRVDARMLAVMAAMVAPGATPPLPENLEDIREIARSREAATAARTALLNQLDGATTDVVRRQIKRQIATAAAAIKVLATAAVTAIKRDPEFHRRYEILTSIPGVGDVTAICLIANMPELGHIDEKQAGMLAGLAPIACESGQSASKRRIRGGRAVVRTGTYMGALSAIKHNPPLTTFYDRLVAAGKPKKLVIAAVMRKLIVLANTLLKADRCWSIERPFAEPLHA
jgi:transposase